MTIFNLHDEWQRRHEDLKIENMLSYCVASGKIDFWIQPVLNSLGQIVAGEILIRWHFCNVFAVTTEKIIELAEKSDLVDEISYQSLDFAVNVLRYLRIMPHLTFSINISPKQIVKSAFIKKLEQIQTHLGSDSKRLTIELTEREKIADVLNLQNSIKQIKRLGFRISLDDFGHQYSNIDRILQLDVDEIKLDRSVAKTIPHCNKTTNLVDALVSFAKKSNLSLVVEGVETSQQASWCSSRKEIKQQGYFYSKAIPFDEFVDKL